MSAQGEMPAARILPLFGSGVPLCWCGAEAEPYLGRNGDKVYPTLCQEHRKTEQELTQAAIDRADEALSRMKS